MFTRAHRRTTRIRAFFAAAVLHALALAALLMPWSRPEPVVLTIDSVLDFPAAPRQGGGGGWQAAATPGATPVVKATPKPKPTPLFVEPKPIDDAVSPIPTGTTVASNDPAVGPGDPNAPIGPGVPDGLPDSDCVGEHCTGSLPGGPNPVNVDKIGIRPIAIYQPQPPYPASARAMGTTGTVIIEILVGVDGRVRDAKLVKGSAPFDTVALASVRTWRYQPVFVGGQAVVWKSTVSLKFQLR